MTKLIAVFIWGKQIGTKHFLSSMRLTIPIKYGTFFHLLVCVQTDLPFLLILMDKNLVKQKLLFAKRKEIKRKSVSGRNGRNRKTGLCKNISQWKFSNFLLFFSFLWLSFTSQFCYLITVVKLQHYKPPCQRIYRTKKKTYTKIILKRKSNLICKLNHTKAFGI